MKESKWGFAIAASEDKAAAKKAVAKEKGLPASVRTLVDDLIDRLPDDEPVNVSSSGRVQDGVVDITVNVNNNPTT